MSRLLADLLNAKEPTFTLALRDLERESQKPGVDLKLTAEIIQKVKIKTRELGLDAADTTGEELYHALLSLVRRHDEFLVKRIGGSDPADVADLLPRIKSTIEGLKIPKSCWALKASVAKRMLLKMPPKKVMKQLGYRSIESMLKRENVAEIYGALRFAESPEWMRRFLEQYKKLRPSDFEPRQIKIIVMDKKRWSKLAEPFVHKKKHNITHLKELGVILMLPMPVTELRGITITALPLLVHYINEIRLYSTFFKIQQMKPNFGSIIVDTLIADPGTAYSLASHPTLLWQAGTRESPRSL